MWNDLANTESIILSRHQFKPARYIYHNVEERNLASVLKSDRLAPGHRGLLSFTANPHLKQIIPETKQRRYTLILDFQKLRSRLFPVYYMTDREWDSQRTPSGVKAFFISRGAHRTGEQITIRNEVFFLGDDIFPYESEWKSTHAIYPLSAYLVAIRDNKTNRIIQPPGMQRRDPMSVLGALARGGKDVTELRL